MAWWTLPMILGGGKTIDFLQPMRAVFQRLREVERDPGVLGASALMVHPWDGDPHLGWSTVVLAIDDLHLVSTAGPAMVMHPAFYTDLGLSIWRADIVVVKSFFPFYCCSRRTAERRCSSAPRARPTSTRRSGSRSTGRCTRATRSTTGDRATARAAASTPTR